MLGASPVVAGHQVRAVNLDLTMPAGFSHSLVVLGHPKLVNVTGTAVTDGV